MENTDLPTPPDVQAFVEKVRSGEIRNLGMRELNRGLHNLMKHVAKTIPHLSVEEARRLAERIPLWERRIAEMRETLAHRRAKR